jgi:hypothetical protein
MSPAPVTCVNPVGVVPLMYNIFGAALKKVALGTVEEEH